jgi:hypothetical protein
VVEDLPELGEEGEVRREPGDLVELLPGQPAERVVLVGRRRSRREVDKVRGQHVAGLDRDVPGKRAQVVHLAAEFLPDLADDRFGDGLAAVHLAAREFPPPCDVGRPGTPGRQHPALSEDGRGRDLRCRFCRHRTLLTR